MSLVMLRSSCGGDEPVSLARFRFFASSSVASRTCNLLSPRKRPGVVVITTQACEKYTLLPVAPAAGLICYNSLCCPRT